MTRKSVPYKGVKYHYYYCPTTKRRGCTDAPTLKESDIAECILDSIKAHIMSVISLDAMLAGSDGQKVVAALTNQYTEQITDNKRQLEQSNGFKSSLYENMINGIITKEDYKSLKAKYVREETLLTEAISLLESQLEDVIAGKSERLKWTEQFRRFDGLTELDRRTVASLIQSIRVTGKEKLQITYNYQAEYEIALTLLERKVA
jgi:ribosomal protein S17E